jgi:hypothetical protein
MHETFAFLDEKIRLFSSAIKQILTGALGQLRLQLLLAQVLLVREHTPGGRLYRRLGNLRLFRQHGSCHLIWLSLRDPSFLHLLLLVLLPLLLLHLSKQLLDLEWKACSRGLAMPLLLLLLLLLRTLLQGLCEGLPTLLLRVDALLLSELVWEGVPGISAQRAGRQAC